MLHKLGLVKTKKGKWRALSSRKCISPKASRSSQAERWPPPSLLARGRVPIAPKRLADLLASSLC